MKWFTLYLQSIICLLGFITKLMSTNYPGYVPDHLPHGFDGLICDKRLFKSGNKCNTLISHTNMNAR